MLRRQALIVLTEEKRQGAQRIYSTVLYEPRLQQVDNDTIIVLANFFVRSLANRIGLKQAREVVESSLFANSP